MNPEHTAKTLAALQSLARSVDEAHQKLMDALKELNPPSGITYYQQALGFYGCFCKLPDAPDWIIVLSGGHQMPIEHKGRTYVSKGLDGPPPGAFIERVNISGIEHYPFHQMPADIHGVNYFLLVEEIPEKP